MSRELLYLDLALENVARAAAERGAGKAAGAAAAPLVGPLLQVGPPLCTQMKFHIRYSCSLPLVEQPLLHLEHMGAVLLPSVQSNFLLSSV